MTITINDTRTLTALAQKVIVADSFFVDMLFPNQTFHNTKFIDVETIIESEAIAGFVAPCVRGEVVGDPGSRIDSFAPAYIKLEKDIVPCNYMERLPGEPYNSGLTPQRRMMLDLQRMQMDLEKRIKRRLELMAAEALLYGTATIQGDSYPRRVVDFGRDPGNTIVNLPADYWAAGTSEPLAQIATGSQVILDAIGVGPGMLVMDTTSYTELSEHQNFVDMLDVRRGITEVPNISPMIAAKRMFRGFLGEIAVWTYGGTYVDPTDGLTKRYLPEHRALLIAEGDNGLMGEQAYGVIQDVKVMEAMARFSKMWDDEGSGTRKLVTQTAPLLIPKRPNAVVTIHTGL